jgi:ABC-type multidrug transport system ATPase subunit
MEWLIETSDLVKKFGNVAVLNEENLKVPKGISGFIGNNGAGKTTTIGVLLGLLKPTKGYAKIFGLNCWADSFAIRSRLGIMHELHSFPSNFTGMHFLEYTAKFYNLSSIDYRQIDEILIDVGLDDVKSKQIKAYSAGMLRRLGLAQALINKPEMVILDEPTANIDPLGRIAILEKIKEMNKKHGTSFLISTHILSDLEKLCSWLSIIDHGKIIAQGNIEELSRKYSANTFSLDVSNPDLFVEKLIASGIVESFWIEEGKVYLKTSNPVILYEQLPVLISNLKLQLREFQHIASSLEEIYKETTSAYDV